MICEEKRTRVKPRDISLHVSKDEDDFRTRDQLLSPHGWRQEPNDFFNLGDTQAGLLVNATLQCAALVFRGTLGLGDIITDAEFVLDDWLHSAGQVHRGFRDALQKVWGRIEARLTGFPHPVFYTGHGY